MGMGDCGYGSPEYENITLRKLKHRSFIYDEAKKIVAKLDFRDHYKVYCTLEDISRGKIHVDIDKYNLNEAMDNVPLFIRDVYMKNEDWLYFLYYERIYGYKLSPNFTFWEKDFYSHSKDWQNILIKCQEDSRPYRPLLYKDRLEEFWKRPQSFLDVKVRDMMDIITTEYKDKVKTQFCKELGISRNPYKTFEEYFKSCCDKWLKEHNRDSFMDFLKGTSVTYTESHYYSLHDRIRFYKNVYRVLKDVLD